MKLNEGLEDRYIRIALGLILFSMALIFRHMFGITLAVLGTILLLTGIVGFCPIYRLLGMNTCPR